MDVMFYSLKEVAEKLNKTEEEVKDIVRQGRLREFREGPNSLFKVDEVKALMSDPSIMPSKEPTAPSGQKPDEDKISFAPESTTTPEPIEIPEIPETPELAMTPEMAATPEPPETPEPIEIPEITETPEPAMTPEMAATPEPPETPEPIEIPEITETPEPAMTPEMAATPEPPETPEPIETPEPTETPELIETPEPAMTPEPIETSELFVPPEPVVTPEPIEITEPVVTPEPVELPELIETPEPAMTPEPPETQEPIEIPELTETPELAMTPEMAETPEPIETPEPAMTQEATETPEPIETPLAESDLSSADTAIAGEGIDVLEEMDTGLQATDDTVIEAKDTTAETPLQEIEEDVNLDSFGSGSGLLDLSLQADDTSLGGILDEIYAPEAGEGQQAEETTGSAVEMAAEAAQMLPDEEFAAPRPARAIPAMARAYVEPEPDTMSNAFGYMLILAFAAVVYTAIVAVTGFRNIMPAILEKVQGIIWHILVGVAVVAGLIVLIAFMLSGKTATGDKKKKAKKGKKAKEAPVAEEEETA